MQLFLFCQQSPHLFARATRGVVEEDRHLCRRNNDEITRRNIDEHFLDQLNHFENYPEFGTMINIAWEKMALTLPIAATLSLVTFCNFKYCTILFDKTHLYSFVKSNTIHSSLVFLLVLAIYER